MSELSVKAVGAAHAEATGEIQAQPTMGDVVELARSVVVNDEHDMETAATIGKEIKAREKKIKEWFDPLVKRANDTHKALTKKRREALGPAQEAQDILGRKITEYRNKRKAEEAAAVEAARVQAQAEAEKEKAEWADQMAKAGDHKAANAIMAAPVDTSHVKSEKIEKAAGTIERTSYKFEVTDKMALLKARPDLITVNEKALGAQVRAMGKDAIDAFPGVKVWPETTTTFKA